MTDLKQLYEAIINGDLATAESTVKAALDRPSDASTSGPEQHTADPNAAARPPTPDRMVRFIACL